MQDMMTYLGKVSKDRVTAEQHFDRLLEAFSEEAESFTEKLRLPSKREAQGEDVEIKPEGGHDRFGEKTVRGCGRSFIPVTSLKGE
jgi:hypothetical protein